MSVDDNENYYNLSDEHFSPSNNSVLIPNEENLDDLIHEEEKIEVQPIANENEIPEENRPLSLKLSVIFIVIYIVLIFPLAGFFAYNLISAKNNCKEINPYFIVSIIMSLVLVIEFILIRKYFTHPFKELFKTKEKIMRVSFDLTLIFIMAWHAAWQEKFSEYNSCKEHSYMLWTRNNDIIIFWITFHVFILSSLFTYYLHRLGVLRELTQIPRPSSFGIVIIFIYLIFVLLPAIYAFIKDIETGSACSSELKAIRNLFILFTIWIIFFTINSGYFLRVQENITLLYKICATITIYFSIAIFFYTSVLLIKLYDESKCEKDHYSIWCAYVIDISVWLAMSWVMSVTEFIEKFKQIGEKINLIINARKILYSLFLFGMFVGSFDVVAIILFGIGDICEGKQKLWLVVWMYLSNFGSILCFIIALSPSSADCRMISKMYFTAFIGYIYIMNFIGIWKIINNDECRKEHFRFWILCTAIIMTWFYLPCAYLLNLIYSYYKPMFLRKCLRYKVKL